MSSTLVAAPDKFKGTATAMQVAEAIRAGAGEVWNVDLAPMADGGDGTLDVLGGSRRRTRVTGPLGVEVEAEWILKGDVAVIEMAKTSGLLLAGGQENNDPMNATTAGTGELIITAMRSGATRVLVGMGGSATTDGGLGAVKAMWPVSRIAEIELDVLVDTQVRFLDAPRIYGPQKGATPAQIAMLERRLELLAGEYKKDFGVDVAELDGAGAAGGLAGGLAAVGGEIISGFGQLADEILLDERIANASMVVTGEGSLDAQSFTGKVVGGVLGIARNENIPVVVIAGVVDPNVLDDSRLEDVTVLSLTELFGAERAMTQTTECIASAMRTLASP